MEIQLNQDVLKTMEEYALPKYQEIPNVGLYLNQVAKFINEYLAPFCDMQMTESMISNYVKKHLVANPVKKQYDRSQIAYLIFIVFSKSVLSMENIRILFTLQKEICDAPVAYDYFASEFENVLKYIYGITDTMEEIGEMQNDAKTLCRNVIISAVRKMYLDHCFRGIQEVEDVEK